MIPPWVLIALFMVIIAIVVIVFASDERPRTARPAKVKGERNVPIAAARLADKYHHAYRLGPFFSAKDSKDRSKGE